MTAPGRTPGGGLWVSLQRLLATALELGRLRLDLLAAEFEREKLRIFDGLLWAAASLLLLGLGVLLLAVLLLLALPASLQLPALGLLAALCLGGAAWLARAARQRLASPGGPLPATRAELAADHAAVTPPLQPRP
jgi:uncharacterized membrane protein YqjE